MRALRLYVPGADEFDKDGYPVAWSNAVESLAAVQNGHPAPPLAIKDLVREQAGHRCVRCGHPYRVRMGMGEWSPCDERCIHAGPCEGKPFREIDSAPWHPIAFSPQWPTASDWASRMPVRARYRILTVHHLDGDKANCRWWNLVALCQRCHLEIQGRVVMDRVWPHEHSRWFRPYVAGYYALRYLGEEIGRDEAEARIDELLALEIRQLELPTAGVRS